MSALKSLGRNSIWSQASMPTFQGFERNLGWRGWDALAKTVDQYAEDACAETSECDAGFICARVWRKVDSTEASVEDIEDETEAENEVEGEVEDLIEGEQGEEGGAGQEAAPEDRAVFAGAWRWGRRTSVRKCVRKSVFRKKNRDISRNENVPTIIIAFDFFRT